MTQYGHIASHLALIRARIAAAATAAGRDPAGIELIAVSKTHPQEAVRAAMNAGQGTFGENRVQEAQAKFAGLRGTNPSLRLHLIGPLQSNKARDAVALFDAIQSVDREKIARALSAEMTRQGRRPQLFIEVNTGLEPQKAGILPAALDGFIRLCREELGLDPAGLMCIPPVDQHPAPHFALLREMARRNRLAALSMGMSGDYETAIALGATHVRVGTAIFGNRAAPTGD